MTKRILSATESFELRQALHVAALDALMTSRRWAPGDLVFQGGTSLHLAHGSPRFSEDLDFLVNASLKLDTLSDAVQARLADLAWLPPGTHLAVSKAKDAHNPHAFVITVSGPNVIGSVRVKIELWQTSGQALSAITAVVAPVRLARGPAAGMQTFVPTADLPEIYADKVFALGARPYLKPRDIFDIHWLHTQHLVKCGCTLSDLRVRLTTYPNETPAGWLAKARIRHAEIGTSVSTIVRDLHRWLPASWPVDDTTGQEMTTTAMQALAQGMAVMQQILVDTTQP